MNTRDTYEVGTKIKVTNTVDEMADPRNVGRLGVVRSIIIAPTEGMDALYEIEFTDGDREPHWMDVEAGLTNGNSTHFHGELAKVDEATIDTAKVNQLHVLSCFDQIEEIVSWLRVDSDDRPQPELAYYVELGLQNNARWSGYLTRQQWQDVKDAELRFELMNA